MTDKELRSEINKYKARANTRLKTLPKNDPIIEYLRKQKNVGKYNKKTKSWEVRTPKNVQQKTLERVLELTKKVSQLPTQRELKSLGVQNISQIDFSKMNEFINSKFGEMVGTDLIKQVSDREEQSMTDIFNEVLNVVRNDGGLSAHETKKYLEEMYQRDFYKADF